MKQDIQSIKINDSSMESLILNIIDEKLEELDSMKKEKKYRIPRKLKKKIPKGYYCYTYVKPLYDDKNNYRGYRIKPCPFFTCIKVKDMKPLPYYIENEEDLKELGEEIEGWCKYLKYEIEDQCKSCRYKKDW